MSESPSETTGDPAVSNPYVQAPVVEDVSPVRPTGITVVAVVCIVAGILGGLSSVGSLANTLFAQRFAAMFTPQGEAGKIQVEMQRETMAIFAKYYIPNLLIGFLGIILGVALVAGGIGLLQRKRWGRTWIRRTLLVAIILECVRIVTYSLMQFEIFPVTKEYMQKIANAQGGPMGGETVAWFSTIGVVVGMVFFIGWFLIKLFLMIWGRRYLAKPMLDSYFVSPESSR
ncbi:hypothetical protein SH528x_001797 [Novipirellula sp. SH528]|uniref:hypothetical protein n=1 Tax=Novipirellula sp. SH528 TaxID=3454466 RepID=UPI003F9FB605